METVVNLSELRHVGRLKLTVGRQHTAPMIVVKARATGWRKERERVVGADLAER